MIYGIYTKNTKTHIINNNKMKTKNNKRKQIQKRKKKQQKTTKQKKKGKKNPVNKTIRSCKFSELTPFHAITCPIFLIA